MNNKLAKVMMFIAYSFLYLPLLLIIILSFNSSRVMGTWKSFSLRWYQILFEDAEMIQGFITSLKVAASSATIAVILGSCAGIALARFKNFKGRNIFKNVTSIPFIMPEVITGFSLLLLFINLEHFFGWPEGRGIKTIILAHVTLGMAYVAALVQVRMSNLNKDIEEAAMDLGARPLKVFLVIILPLISPTLIAGWLLSFTISFDDLVLASFTSGPSSMTLPMLIYSRIRLGVSPEINALATITIVFVSLVVSIATLLIVKKKYYNK
jgi:putrescine transport system permease protein